MICKQVYDGSGSNRNDLIFSFYRQALGLYMWNPSGRITYNAFPPVPCENCLVFNYFCYFFIFINYKFLDDHFLLVSFWMFTDKL